MAALDFEMISAFSGEVLKTIPINDKWEIKEQLLIRAIEECVTELGMIERLEDGHSAVWLLWTNPYLASLLVVKESGQLILESRSDAAAGTKFSSALRGKILMRHTELCFMAGL